MKGWKKIFHINGNPKKPGVAISVKTDFKPDCNRRQRRVFYIDKRINSPRRYNIGKLCTKVGAPKHIKQILAALKGEMNSSSTIGGDFNTSLSTRMSPFRQDQQGNIGFK